MYADKFRDIGLPISNEDAKEIGNVVTDIVTAPKDKIEEKIFENVSGGGAAEKIRDAGLLTGAVTGVASAGLLLSEIVCRHAGVDDDKCRLMLKLSGAGALVSAGSFTAAGVAHGMTRESRTTKQIHEAVISK